MGEIRSSAC